MATHAKFSPSKLSRILACPASASAKDGKSSPYAEEGTMLHDATEKALSTYLAGGPWFNVLKRDFNLTTEQLDAVEECVLYGIEVIKSIDDPQVNLETRVFIAEDCDGTVDCLIYGNNEIHVLDWKFGSGVEVAAFENTQLRAYAFGASELYRDAHKATMHIVQPRINNFDKYEATVVELTRWVEHTVKPGLTLAASKNAPFNPSSEACRWCPRKATCAARLQMTMKSAEEIFAEHAKLPDVSLEALQFLIPKAEEVEQVIKDLKALAMQQLSDGQEVPGYKLVRGRSNRVWVDQEAAGEFLATHLDPEDMYEMKMVSPAKAEKLLDRELRKDDDFLSLVHKPDGKPTLAPESDKREAISLDAESVFANCAE